jgi:hypothetical protein
MYNEFKPLGDFVVEEQELGDWPSTYKCLKQTIFREGDYVLSPISILNAETIRVWRNSQIQFLRQKREITQQEQQLYFLKNVRPNFYSANPPQLLFEISESGIFIGYGGLVHISWEDKRAEISFLTSPERSQSANYETDFRHFLSLIKFIAKEKLGLHKLMTETYDGREIHLKTLISQGFCLEGRLIDHIAQMNEYRDALIHGLIL